MRSRTLGAGVLLAVMLSLCLVGLTAGPASAHEERTIGPWHVEVGFGTEPPYAGFENSVQLIIADAHGTPLTDLGDSLDVEVMFGAQTMPLTLEPNFEVGGDGVPGDYRAWFVPTSPGVYSFHFTGSIKGTKMDETFTSSPTTFDSVIDPTSVEFPVKYPTAGQIAGRLDRESARLAAATAAATTAADRADSARTIAVLAVVVGTVGLIVGVAALVVAGRKRS